MKKIKISPFSIIWGIALIYFKTPHLPALLFAIFVHEMGHVFIAKVLKIRLRSFEVSLLGAKIEAASELSYSDEFLLALGGPLFGFLGFALSIFPSFKYSYISFFSDYLLPFAIISLCLALFNLIPISIFDGGRMLKCILCKLFTLDFAEKVLKISSFLTLFSLWLFSVYLMLKSAAGLPMFVFCVIFFVKCFIFNTKNGENARF